MKKLVVILALVSLVGFAQQNPDYSPKFSGYVRAWHQTDLATGQGQYLVRQARLGINGEVNEYAGYKLLFDFTRLGSLKTTSGTTTAGEKFLTGATASFSDVMLDAAVSLKPIKNLEISAGQFKVPFSTDNLKSDQNGEFSNRPLLVGVSPSIRDIGISVGYKIKGPVDAEVIAGSFNGSGMNKSENDKSTDYSFRALVSPINNLVFQANYYGAKVGGYDANYMNFGALYKFMKFVVEGEFGGKTAKTSAADLKSNSYFAQATYSLPFPGNFVKEVIPAVRYEMYDPNSDVNDNEIGRITVGLSFEFAKFNFARFRVNYEKYDYKDGVTTNPDKLIFELQTRF
ncbi:MAG TPA: porin [Ignavibacteriaceae bacterium]|nr:porin [Ignavibacteriaceae bacterium]